MTDSAAGLAHQLPFMPGTPLYGRVLAFLYREASLLDAHRYPEWLALLAEDIHYHMPVRINQVRAKGEGFDAASLIDDDLAALTTRVRRLMTDTAWSETPPSRTRHFVANVILGPGAKGGEIEAEIAFMVTRTRADRAHQIFTGRREDLLRPAEEGGFKIARRRILLDQTVLTNTNLSILF